MSRMAAVIVTTARTAWLPDPAIHNVRPVIVGPRARPSFSVAVQMPVDVPSVE
jgi:hypothetical protein